ncbi:fungal-specific transcription factor domain-containing protein [Fusarium flagelliforme]|uniref:Uncharacterized protein n=1 Tax=Fusarium flagelliforme TaxID=2675880 RepID=A0A395MSK0_9HYPO|nr:fungal-specific transcription factor domain-containing protein [Fusarium flagelliforme]KAH7185781.1 fungal-specific transcription factor domain-containing protein [Fusarium flagelliforme]RFN50403.1 hypothetical protein FIE12Z_5335 [Fusarium flagelliforme]
MESSPESTRPLKRVKYEQHDDAIPLSIHGPDISVPESINGLNGSLVTDDSFFDNPWPSTSGLSSPSQVLFNLPEDFSNNTTSWAHTSTAPQPATLNLHTVSAPQPELQRQTQLLPRLLPATSEDTSPVENVESQVATRDDTVLFVVSPFTNEDRLTVTAVPRFSRPKNGQVNGYVKFNWPTKHEPTQPIQPSPSARVQTDDGVVDISSQVSRSRSDRRDSGVVFIPIPVTTAAQMQMHSRRMASHNVEIIWPEGTQPPITMTNPTPSPHEVFSRAPRKVPTLFGFYIYMDYLDRRIWEFYINNWCPGRSVLDDTNSWLKDLAPMCSNRGILHAMQALAGVYIYDYLPDERVRQRINQRYVESNQYFIELLNDPESRMPGKGQEVITMAILLSMHDVILTERRLKKPNKPRWLEGFKQGEYFLQQTDPGKRFWKEPKTAVYDPLRISQSIIVGRAVILAQPMMALSNPETMDPQAESHRFNWLLYGTERDLFEIHGGCGFSKKLLHTMSQVTYCAARLWQEPETAIVPVTARYLSMTLTTMRQWTREGAAWEECQRHPQTINWVRKTADDFVISSKNDMTNVTAEAWRIAAIIYYQCRLLRLPRTHPEVLANMNDLAKCINIMPTSGTHFTAQAPLLPVFFLGMLATDPAHREISRGWFEQVVNTPVRSSVPPLYAALKRIWKIIDTDATLQCELISLPESLGQRVPWWEYLVDRVEEQEDETLCLT